MAENQPPEPRRDIQASAMGASEAAAQAAQRPNLTSYCSMEQIFSPIQINRGNAAGQGGSGAAEMAELAMTSLSEDEDGRFSGGQSSEKGAVGPTRMELDPYFSQIFGDDGTRWMRSVDYTFVRNNGKDVRYQQVGGELNLNKVIDENGNPSRDDISSVRTVALRGPLIVSGWGYDLAERPAIPAADDFQLSWATNVNTDRTTWATGPVDLKWDSERMVWSGGHQLVCGVVEDGVIPICIDPCNPSKFTIRLLRLGNEGGIATSGETVECSNRDPYWKFDNPGSPTDNMVFVVAARINYEWIPIFCGANDNGNRVPSLAGHQTEGFCT